MTNTRSGMTHAAIEEMINQRVNAALEAHQVNQNLELGNGNNNGNGNGNDNGNGNRNDNGNGNGNDNGTYEEYAMAPKEFKKFTRDEEDLQDKPRGLNRKTFQKNRKSYDKSERKCFRCGDPNHFIGECSKPPKNTDQRAFIGGVWSDNGEDEVEKTKDEACLIGSSAR
ncbi:alpha/beta hydrolases superfamily protein [Tanacetum coccineum]|uniref:Alpha/beta hydrolases superfamily protein n=1 Tax=Tanacetum coccineum TaxID=301880 RepID=A0ABQ4X9P9_9ASTR